MLMGCRRGMGAATVGLPTVARIEHTMSPPSPKATVGTRRARSERRVAEREGFEPPCRLRGKTLSRRPRYDHFGTSPRLRSVGPLYIPHLTARSGLRPSLAAAGASENSFQLPASSSQKLPPFPKELLDHIAAFRFEHAAGCRHPMIQRRMFVRAHDRFSGTGTRLEGAIHQARDPGVHHRAEAHLTRFDRHV